MHVLAHSAPGTTHCRWDATEHDVRLWPFVDENPMFFLSSFEAEVQTTHHLHDTGREKEVNLWKSQRLLLEPCADLDSLQQNTMTRELLIHPESVDTSSTDSFAEKFKESSGSREFVPSCEKSWHKLG